MMTPAMNLPEDVWTEIILMKLPFDSLVSMSRTCKSWRDMIRKNPYFVEKHLNKNKNNDPLIFFRRSYLGSTEDLIFSSYTKNNDPSLLSSRGRNSSAPYMKAIGSCNGIVCLVEPYQKEVHLCNPGTGEDRQLPHHVLRDRFDSQYMGFGFGYDASTKDYKVVVILSGHPKVKFYADIYKLSAGRWSKVHVQDCKCEDQIDINGVFLNGFYHWWTSGKHTILTFDFENETFGAMQFPDEEIRDNYQCMGALDNSLAICFTKGTPEVWVMTEYGNSESWMKKFSLQLSTLFNVNSFWPVHDMNQLMLLGPHLDRVHLEACPVGREDAEYRARTLLQIKGGAFRSGDFFQPSLVSLCSPFDLKSFFGTLLLKLRDRN